MMRHLQDLSSRFIRDPLMRMSFIFITLIMITSVESWKHYNSHVAPEETDLHTTTPQITAVNNVYILEETTFQSFINSEPSVLVLFYASWCHWCIQFLPIFAEAAEIIASQSLPVKLAKIDASIALNISDTYDIRVYPVLKLFLDGEPHLYDGGRQTSSLVKWVIAHLQTEIVVSSKQQLDTLLLSNRDVPTLVARFDESLPNKSASRKSYIELSRKIDHVVFIETNESEAISSLIKSYKAPAQIATMKEFVILINPHAQKQPEYEQPTVLYTRRLDDLSALNMFIKSYLFPEVIDFDAEMAPRAFKDGRPIWVLFTSQIQNDKLSVHALKQIRELAKQYRQDILFFHSDGHSVFDKRLQNLLGVETEKLPTVRLFHMNPNGHSTWYSTLKYRPSAQLLDSFELSGLVKFISDFQNNKLRPFVKSEPIPEENLGPVKTLVAEQFEELVHKSRYDVLVEFYAPWCGHCRTLEPIYREVGTLLSRVEHIDVMKMDATQNEVNLVILGYPTLILFVADKGTPNQKRSLHFLGDRTTENIIKWVASHSSQKFNAEELLKHSSESDLQAKEIIQQGDAKNWIIDDL